MDVERFDGLWRALAGSGSRRGALAGLVGFGASALTHAVAARRAKKRRKAPPNRGAAGRVSAASVSAAPLITEGHSDAERVLLLAHFDGWPLWEHTDLTVALHEDGSVDAPYVATVRQAIAIWSAVLARHFDGLVTLTDVTDDHQRAVKADLRVHLKTDWAGRWFIGMARCNGQKCRNLFVKSDWPEESWSRDREDIVVSPELAGKVAIHELGHALGLGHANPILTTNDIMGYGFLPWFHFPPREPVLSACGLKALDAIWAWAVDGTAPARPTVAEIVC